MGFLAPWFLAGFAAIGLPIWLHLLRKHRSTPLPFSSLMFFERRTQSSIKHRRLQYLLLFSLRTALLLLIALAFAQPYLKSGAGAGAGGGLLVLALDNSFSMREGGRMARAKREALAQVKPGRREQVIAFSSQAHLLTQPASDAATLRGAIESIQPADSRSSYGELVRVLRVLAGSPAQPLEIHLFSDFQKSSLPPAFADLRLPAGSQLVPHPVASEAAPNWAVESVTAPHRVYDVAKPRVQAVVAGFGTPAASRRVSLLLNGQVVETKAAGIAANGRASVEFSSFEAPHGFSRAEVRIDPADSLAADDRYYFTIEHADPKTVLFVGRSGLVYFRAALEASANFAFRLEDRSEAPAGIDLAKYAFVVLSDPGAIPAEFDQALRRYVRAGGSVWVALGPAAAARRSVPLIEARSVEDRYFSRDAERFQTVSYVDSAHPSVRRANNWSGVRFYQVVRFQAPGAKVIARLNDQTPVLVEAAQGEGRVLVFSSTFDNLANDFPLRSSFVPFVEQTARYLSGLDEGAPSVTVDSYLSVRAARDRGAAVEVVGPDGRRALTLKEAATVEAFGLAREGFYEVHRSNGAHDVVAVNADRRESDLSLIPPETLALWRKTGGGLVAAGAAGETAPARRSVWWYVLALALALAVAESLVGNRHLSVAREEPLRKEAAA